MEILELAASQAEFKLLAWEMFTQALTWNVAVLSAAALVVYLMLLCREALNR